jgi:hypothetical protein
MLSAVGNFARITPPAKVNELETLRNLKDLAANLNRKVFWICFDETQASDYVNRYYFDFVLREGPCKSGNAIRLIELKEYPPNVVAEARRLAANQ